MKRIHSSVLLVLVVFAAFGLGWLYTRHAATASKLSAPSNVTTSSVDIARKAASQLQSASGVDQMKAEKAAEVLVQQRTAAAYDDEHDVRVVIEDAIDRVEGAQQRAIRETTKGLTETIVGCIANLAAQNNLDLAKMREARDIAHADAMDFANTGPKSRAYVDAMWPVVGFADQCEKRLVGAN